MLNSIHRSLAINLLYKKKKKIELNISIDSSLTECLVKFEMYDEKS